MASQAHTDAAAGQSPLRPWRTRWLKAVGFALTSLWLTGYSLAVLASSLPEAYRVTTWRLTWVVFDLGLAMLVALDGVLMLRRARALPLALGITAGCFICDAWFDCATSGASAGALRDVLGELPAAAICISVGLRRG
jgi:hypothetical protein